MSYLIERIYFILFLKSIAMKSLSFDLRVRLMVCSVIGAIAYLFSSNCRQMK